MNKKGFTLVELLAIIVILGVIFVFAIPMVENFIIRAKKDSIKSSALSYMDAASKEAFNNENSKIVDIDINKPCYINIINKIVDIKGMKPDGDEDYLVFNEDYRIIEGYITIEDYEIQIVDGNIVNMINVSSIIPDAPVINDNVTKYPTIMDKGIFQPGIVSIEFPSSGSKYKNFYSIDNGLNWIEYNSSFSISGTKKIMAKTIYRNRISSHISSKLITVSSASDALPFVAYDNNSSTNYNGSTGCGNTRYIFIDESMYNKRLKVNQKSWDKAQVITIYFYDSSDHLLSSLVYQTSNTSVVEFTIPNNSKKMGIYMSGVYCDATAVIYDITINTEPIINVLKSYTKIYDYGIEIGKNMINLEFFPTSLIKEYSLDGGLTWNIYNNEVLKINAGVVITARGTDNNGIQSTKSYTSSLLPDGIPVLAYDNNLSTNYNGSSGCNNWKYMEIDSSMIGRRLNVYQKSWSGAQVLTFGFFNKDNALISSLVYQTNNTSTVTFTIPNETVKLGIYMSGTYCDSTAVVYDISINTEPIITNTSYFAKIFGDRIDLGYNELQINYFSTSINKKYTIDGGITWNDYLDKIKLDDGKTITAKGIDSNNVETSKSYSSTLPSNAVPKSAYDKSNATSYTGTTGCSNWKYMDVDDSSWGKFLSVYQRSWNGAQVITFAFYNELNQTINSLVYQTSSTSTIKFAIPPLAKKMGIYMSGAYCGNTAIIYDITVTN